MNKKRSVRKLDGAHSSYRGRVHNIYCNEKNTNTSGKNVPMNSFSPGHPILGNLKDKDKK